MLDNEEMRDLGLWHVGLFGVGQWKGVGKGLAAVSIGTKGRPAGAIVSVPGPSEKTQRRWPESAPEGLVDVWEIPEARDEQLVRVIAAGGADVARSSGARHLGPARITEEAVSVPGLQSKEDRPSYRYGLTVALTESWLKLLMLGGGAHTLVCLTVQRELFGENGMPGATSAQLQKATAAMGMALVVNETEDGDEPVTVEQAKDALTALSETQQNEQTQMAVVVLRSLVEQPLATCSALARRAMVREMAKTQGCQALPAVQLAVGNLLSEQLVRRCGGTDDLPVYEVTVKGDGENRKIARELEAQLAAKRAAEAPQRVKVVADGGALSVDNRALVPLIQLQCALASHRYRVGEQVDAPTLANMVNELTQEQADDLPALTTFDLTVGGVWSWLREHDVIGNLNGDPNAEFFVVTDACLRAAELA